MGQEINKNIFDQNDFIQFSDALSKETDLLRQMFKNNAFDSQHYVAGLELEAWLINSAFRPVPINQSFFTKANQEYLTPELAKFNIELNVDPVELNTNVLSNLERSIRTNWHQCRQAAQSLNSDVMAIGILPTLKDEDLIVENMSTMARYEALNDQILKKRKGKPLHLHIVGKENLESVHYDVMLESAATSMQIHIQVPQEKSVAYYNSSVFISAFTVAASANSPFLFEKNIWEESRIPLFEQAVESGGFDAVADGPLHRVSFGSDYCRDSLMECFEENILHFPVLLPMQFKGSADKLEHLRLHNGTIWRWNRPIIGFNENNQPHLRIEHRVIPSGPTITDQMANIALYYGLVCYFSENTKLQSMIKEFAVAKDNFYKAARHGLNANVKWIDGETYPMQQLFNDCLLNYAQQGLEDMKIDQEDINRYLNVIRNRVSSGKTGSYWQQEFVKKNGHDMRLLTEQYFLHQNAGRPVHEWELNLINV